MSAKHPENRRKPIEVKRGNVTVKVYAVQNRVGKTVYRQYAVVYYDGTRRRKRRFADLSEAKQEAAFVAEKLASGDGPVLSLTAADRSVYIQAL